MINLRDQFGKELFRANLNLAELDGKPCARCGKIPEIVKKVLLDRNLQINGITYNKGDEVAFTSDLEKKEVRLLERSGKVFIDRKNRIDCDGGDRKENLVTYHTDCWKEMASEEDGKTTS